MIVAYHQQHRLYFGGLESHGTLNITPFNKMSEYDNTVQINTRSVALATIQSRTWDENTYESNLAREI